MRDQKKVKPDSMRSKLNYTLILLLVALYTLSVSYEFKYAKAAEVKYDTSNVEVRTAKSIVDSLRSEKEFEYKMAKPEGMSLWDRIVRWIFNKLLNNVILGDMTIGKIILLALFIALVAYLIYKLSSGGRQSMFYSIKGDVTDEFKITDENINKIDYDLLISIAESKNKLKDAVHYNYLRAIAKLNQDGIIAWRTEKTNFHYLNEIRDPLIKKQFSKLTYFFDNIVYGEFPIDKALYDKIKMHFEEFHVHNTSNKAIKANVDE